LKLDLYDPKFEVTNSFSVIGMKYSALCNSIHGYWPMDSTGPQVYTVLIFQLGFYLQLGRLLQQIF